MIHPYKLVDLSILFTIGRIYISTLNFKTEYFRSPESQYRTYDLSRFFSGFLFLFYIYFGWIFEKSQ